MLHAHYVCVCVCVCACVYVCVHRLIQLIGIGFLTIIGIVTVEFKLYASGELFKDIYLWAPVGVGFVVGALLMLCGALGLGGICCEKRGLLKAVSAL